MIASYARCAVRRETRDTRVSAGETLVAVARDVYDPTNVKKNKTVLAI